MPPCHYHTLRLLEARGHERLAKKLQNQYFHCTHLQQGEEVWDAPWRSAPDRIMPGTDAGSAPQESWHGNTLKPLFGQLRRKPAEVAKILEDRIVRPQLRVLAAMKHEGRQFQDWPAIFYHAKRCTRSSSSDEHRWVRWVKVYPKTDETLMGVVLYGLGCPPAWNSRSLLVTGQGHYFD